MSSPEKVGAKIEAGDPWYVGSHLEWAEQPSIRRIYEARFRFFRECIERARARLGTRLTLLDAGCGDGYWLRRLQAVENLELRGVDYNPLRVERARKLAPSVSIEVGDLFAYDAREPVDILLLNQVIEHVADDMGLLKKAHSLLRPGGMLILGTPNEGCALQRWSNNRRGPSFKTDHVHFYTEPEIRAKIESQKFTVENTMREVFYPGSDRVYYGLTRRGWGFKLLEALTVLIPSQCSDFYFECRPL